MTFEPFVQSYRDASIHQMMLEDAIRTSSYERAIAATCADQRVLDFGAGTGVLSIFAARYGALQVDAVERSSFVHHARRIAQDSGFEQIRFHHTDHAGLQLDHRVNVLVSEWMGHFLFYEAMLEPLIAVRNRFLEQGGIMIPSHVRLHAALLHDDAFFEEHSFFRGNPYGIDFSSIADQPLRQSRCVRVEPRQVAQVEFDLGTLDMKTVESMPATLQGSCRVDRAAMAYGVVAWFSCELSPGVGFGTGPHDPPTHWDQMLFPFPEPFVVLPGRTLQLEIRPPREREEEDPTWAWSLTDGTETAYVDEFETFSDHEEAAAAQEERTRTTSAEAPNALSAEENPRRATSRE